MPYETTLLAGAPMNVEQVHQLPFGPPPTPAPQPSPMSLNTLELHIPIPIPTPPTPLPIVVAYPLWESPVAAEPEHAPRLVCDAIQREDSGLELDPVPAPIQALNLGAEISTESDETLHDPAMPDNDFELLEMSEEERLDAQTLHLFRALNVPLNIHRLRAMRAKGKLPAPLLKFRYGPKPQQNSPVSGKETKVVRLLGILKPSVSVSGLDADADPHGNEPTEMERVQGESWYLPSASARRMTRRRTNREQPAQEYAMDHARAYEIRNEVLPGPRPIIPDTAFLDQFPLPPSSPPILATQPSPYSMPLPPTPSPTPSSSSRPLGYMYAPTKPLRRAPSCKSCGGSPVNSVSSSRTLTPVPPGQGPGCFYAYDLVTPSPGALPYSGLGYARSVSPKRVAAVSPVPLAPQHLI